jgi:hypothetical protein
MPKLHPVSSSSIRAIGYDRVRRELFIDYIASPGNYVYEGVPPTVYAELLVAPSKGRFVNFRVKNHYRYRLVTSEANSQRRA